MIVVAVGSEFGGVASARDGSIVIESLAPPSRGSGPTLFTLMPPERTGIDARNEYDDPRMWGELYNEFSLGAIGTGIAVGDYDNDGMPDIFVVNKTGKSRLYRNLGEWRFEDVTDSAGLGPAESGWTDSVLRLFRSDDSSEDSVEIWKQGATFVDVNNDGWLDLYVCRFNAANVLYMNQGDGTFREAEDAGGLGLVSASGMASFADFDRDGWLDVYVQTNMLNSRVDSEGSPDRLYRNNGDGTFSDVTAAAGISGSTLGHAAIWWDFNEDGWPDLYIANDFAKPDQLFQNDSRDGNIAFTDVINTVVPHQPHSSMGADFGDLNNDGRFDFLVADMAPTKHEMDLRGMAVTRHVMRDEKLLDPSYAPQYMYNALYLNAGVGRMREVAWLAGLARTDWTWSVRFEDLDCDGRLDVHITNGMVHEFQNEDLRQRIFRAEHPSARMRVMRSSPALSEANLAYRNLGGLEFEEVGSQWGLDQVGVSFGAAFGDFDGDGDLDVVVANYDAPPTLLRNDAPSGGRAVFSLRGTSSNRYGVGATVRIWTSSGEQVRQLCLSRGYLSSSEPVAHFGLGDAERIDRATVQWPSGRLQSFSDLPANSRFTVTEPGPGADAPAPAASAPPLFEESGAALGLSLDPLPGPPARRQALAPFGLSRRGPTLASIGLGGEGPPSLLVGSQGSGPTRLLSPGPDGRYLPAAELPWNGAADGPIAVADFDGDGLQDALVSKAGGAPALLLGSGGGALSEAPPGWLPAMDVFAGAAAAADFEGSGLPGAFVGSRAQPGRYPQGGRSYLLANRGGRFEDVSGLLAPGGELGMVTAAVWADVDGDGWPDLVLATEWGPVRYFRNAEGSGFEELTGPAGFGSGGAGLWSCLAAADFNGDGRPDFAAGNLGLNTRYRASEREPALLYWGQLGGRGPLQLAEARFDERGRVAPWRSRGELGEEIPSVLRRFPSNDAYAAATLEEVLGSEVLGRASLLEASELRSGVFLSSADGTYRFEPFERIAQAAPMQSLAVGDFDGDGKLDLAAAQNLFDVDPSVGRFDGGLGQLLLGDGLGGFAAAEPAASGLVAPGDGKAAMAADLDGDGRPDLLISRSGSPLLVFLNRSGNAEK